MTASPITIKRTNSNNPHFPELIILLDNDLRERYGDLLLEYDRYNEIVDLDTVLIAYYNDEPVGCVCFKKFDKDSIEVKRVFVKGTARGLGIAYKLLSELELWAKENGFSNSVLETGTDQPEAMHVYERMGYSIIPNYRQYADMDTSICMQKTL